MNATNYLSPYKSADRYFILDSHQEAMNEQEEGHRYEDEDYQNYSYNVHQFNRLTEGSLFLYRRPGKLSKNGKFSIYGGGIVSSISKPDADGNVVARVKDGFRFESPIDQGDVFIENFVWETRKKPGPGWKGFWINYGMNEIKAKDFWGLIVGRDIALVEFSELKSSTTEEAGDIDDTALNDGFSVVESTDGLTGESKKKKHSVGKIDFTKLNKRRKSLGTAGELIVLKYEQERLDSLGINKKAEHVADTIGDGLGYDIRSYDDLGNEIHIEVKTTKANRCDGFYLSRREMEESTNKVYPYKIYRLYNFNEKTKNVSLRVFEGAITEKDYQLIPQTYKVLLR